MIDINKYSKKRLYSILRSSIIWLAKTSNFLYLVDTYKSKDDIEYNSLLLKVFNISWEDYYYFRSFKSFSNNSFHTAFNLLDENDMCELIKNVIVKLHSEKCMNSLKREIQIFKIQYPREKYCSSNFILKLFDLKAREYNEIINYEDALMLQGVKDTGASEMTIKKRDIIKKFLIVVSGWEKK